MASRQLTSAARASPSTARTKISARFGASTANRSTWAEPSGELAVQVLCGHAIAQQVAHRSVRRGCVLGAAQPVGVGWKLRADDLDRAVAERVADVGDAAVQEPPALVDQHDPVAQGLRVLHVVRAHDDGRAAVALLRPATP